MTAKPLPPEGSTCIYCKRGKIRWHATGATCQYCGRTWDNGLTVPFHEIHEGEFFIIGGCYEKDDPERMVQKIKWQKHPLYPRFQGMVNCKYLETGLYGSCGPDVRCLPVNFETPPLLGNGE